MIDSFATPAAGKRIAAHPCTNRLYLACLHNGRAVRVNRSLSTRSRPGPLESGNRTIVDFSESYDRNNGESRLEVKEAPVLTGEVGLQKGGSPVQFADTLFQLGGFADPGELFACCGDLISLLGRTGNFAACH